jgi:hypothetical protein
LDDNILTQECKESLIEYCGDKTIHSQLECTFEEILHGIFYEISLLEPSLQKSAKERLNEEMLDGLCKCFTGRISRLVNSLNGISNKIIIKISNEEEIGNIISLMKSKYSDINEIIENVKKELLDRGYTNEVINEWISYIE